MARRGTRGEQYLAVAAFYGTALAHDLRDPNVPEFVLVGTARLAGHYAVAALGAAEREANRRATASDRPSDRLLRSRRASVLARRDAVQAIEGSTPS